MLISGSPFVMCTWDTKTLQLYFLPVSVSPQRRMRRQSLLHCGLVQRLIYCLDEQETRISGNERAKVGGISASCSPRVRCSSVVLLVDVGTKGSSAHCYCFLGNPKEINWTTVAEEEGRRRPCFHPGHNELSMTLNCCWISCWVWEEIKPVIRLCVFFASIAIRHLLKNLASTWIESNRICNDVLISFVQLYK